MVPRNPLTHVLIPAVQSSDALLAPETPWITFYWQALAYDATPETAPAASTNRKSLQQCSELPIYTFENANSYSPAETTPPLWLTVAPFRSMVRFYGPLCRRTSSCVHADPGDVPLWHYTAIRYARYEEGLGRVLLDRRLARRTSTQSPPREFSDGRDRTLTWHTAKHACFDIPQGTNLTLSMSDSANNSGGSVDSCEC